MVSFCTSYYHFLLDIYQSSALDKNSANLAENSDMFLKISLNLLFLKLDHHHAEQPKLDTVKKWLDVTCH